MNNFQLIASNVDVAPLLNAIRRQPELWDQNTLRTTHPGTSHGEVNDIWLRFNECKNAVEVVDSTECVNYPPMFALPQARPLIFALMNRVEGERLGRVIITRLPPGGKITPHIDEGTPATYYDRYHIVLHSMPGVMFRAGDEAVNMLSGQVWWFNNNAEHEVVNNSDDDRITMIVDIRTFQ